jgi:hypothetical protein
MLFFGHIALSIAIADAIHADSRAAVAGNLVPDLADKSLKWLGVTPGRWLGHGLPFVALSCAATRPLLPKHAWRGFVLGYTSHLVGDLWGGGKLPLLAPFRGDQSPRAPWYGRKEWATVLAPEVVGLAFLLWRASRRVRGDPV